MFIIALHYTQQYILNIVNIDCTNVQHYKIPHLVAVVDCTNIGSAIARGLGNIAQENTIAGILIENQLQSLDM